MMTGYFTAMSDAGQTPNSGRRAATRAGYVLIVNDDAETREVVGRYLEDHGFSVVTVSSRASVQRHLAMTEPCLVLLDLRLGQDDGLDVLREIRSQSNVPIIIMSGHHLEEVDRVVGLELGADDYIVRPFGLRELLARVRAMLRRQEMARLGRGREPERGGYKFEGWRLERRGRQLIDPRGVPAPLSKGQYALIVAFLDAPQRTLTREYLLQATRVHEDIFDRSVDVQVMRLRRILEPNPASPKMILTQRGVGYVFGSNVERYY